MKCLTNPCHPNCLTVSRFDLLSQFSCSDLSVFKTIPYRSTDAVNSKIISYMERQNIKINCDEITSDFRRQFENLLKVHQKLIKCNRLRYDRPKGQKFVEHVKKQLCSICLHGQQFSRLDFMLYNKFKSLLAEHENLKVEHQSLRRRFEAVVVSIRERWKHNQSLTKKVEAQQKRIQTMTAALSKRGERIAQLKKFSVLNAAGCRPGTSGGMKRKAKCCALNFLKQVAVASPFSLSQITFIPPGQDETATYSFAQNKYVSTPQPVTPDIAVQLMDEIQTSMATYRKLRNRIPFLPSNKTVVSLRKNLVKDVPINEVKNGATWYGQTQFVSLLTCKIRSLLESNRLSRSDKTLRVKISGDGTSLGKGCRVHIVTLCFVIIAPNSTCQSAKDVGTIALARCKENYKDISLAFRSAIEQIKNTKSVTVDEEEYELTYYFCSDYKFKLIILGMKSCSSKCPCLFCTKPKVKFGLPGGKVRARTINNLGNSAEGVSDNAPIIDFIELENFIVDLLHLKLRICDQIFRKTVNLLATADKQKSKTNTECMDRFTAYLLSIGIVWTYWVDPIKKVVHCGLSGTDYDLFLLKFDVKKACPALDTDDLDRLDKVILTFSSIIKILSKLEILPSDIKTFNEKCDQWYANAIQLVPTNSFTIYMHILLEHIGPMLSTHGSISPFANEGIEAYNCIATKRFHGQTNHRDGSLEQMLQADVRAVILATPPTNERAQHCSTCGVKGHKMRTCMTKQNLETPVNSKRRRTSKSVLFN